MAVGTIHHGLSGATASAATWSLPRLRARTVAVERWKKQVEGWRERVGAIEVAQYWRCRSRE